MEEMSRFRNELRQARQKRDKWEGSTKTYLHKSDKRHKPDKRQSLLKWPRYERYTPLMANRITILEEAFNLEVPIRLHPTKPLGLGLDATKYCRYHHSIGHNTKDCWDLKDKIEELTQARYLAWFVKRPENHQEGARPKGNQ